MRGGERYITKLRRPTPPRRHLLTPHHRTPSHYAAYLGVHPLDVPRELRRVDPPEHPPAFGKPLCGAPASFRGGTALAPARSDRVYATAGDAASAVFRGEEVVVCVQPAREQLKQRQQREDHREVKAVSEPKKRNN